MSATATTTATTAPSTIAQALRHIKRQKGRLAELTQRASESVSYEAGKKPAFDFAATRAEIRTARESLIRLEAAVAVANATTDIAVCASTITLAEAIRRLQELKAEIAWLKSLSLKSGTERHSAIDYDEETGRRVFRAVETTFETCLSEPDRAAEIEGLRSLFERLNDLVEAANHRTPVRLAPEQAANA